MNPEAEAIPKQISAADLIRLVNEVNYSISAQGVPPGFLEIIWAAGTARRRILLDDMRIASEIWLQNQTQTCLSRTN